MRATIPIFERRSFSRVECVTLGLGPDTKRREGKNPRKAEAKLIEDLQKLLRKTPAQRLAQFEPVRGTQLVRVRLQLNLVGASERRKIAGRYPFVLEPRWTTATAKCMFAYHPDRQTEVLAVLPDQPLEPQLRVYFQHAWAELDEDALYALESKGKECIHLLSFTCTPRSVMEELPENQDALRGGGAIKINKDNFRGLQGFGNFLKDGGRRRGDFRRDGE